MAKELQVITGRLRQEFSEEEKINLVKASYSSHLSLNQFAKKSGISPAALCRWRKLYKQDTSNVICIERSEDRSQNVPESFENAITELNTLKVENRSLKEQIFRLKTILGHKVFEIEGSSYSPSLS